MRHHSRPIFKILAFFLLFLLAEDIHANVITGAEQTNLYLRLLKGKRVALFSNQTGRIGNRLTLDVLLEHHVNVVTVFSPEHGFRGKADAGEKVSSSVDEQTGVRVFSLYGASKNAPDDAEMKKIDVIVTDIQDVGLRFYTYYITMMQLMNRCAECGKEMIVLDRPNPNGFYVDGPILDMKYASGVGALPIPIVHGMTLGELARMINGEHWLKSGKTCRLKVIPCKNYTHQTRYVLPVAPSPNLPNMKSVYLYPSLCYFEATPVSVGRGTDKAFQIFGHPDMKCYAFTFTPESRTGAKNPPLLGQLCHGRDLSGLSDSAIWSRKIDLTYLIEAYHALNIGDRFFTSFFEKLMGVGYVRTMIEEGKSADEISKMWQEDVEKFKKQRKKYLLYKE
jgi:uncharacterized protein YbbC (DUF1343 family)